MYFQFFFNKQNPTYLELTKLFQKDNAHLAEAAATLTRLIQKEIPAADRSILKLKQRQVMLCTVSLFVSQ